MVCETLINQEMSAEGTLDSLPGHHMNLAAFSPKIISGMSLRPLPSIKVPMAPNRFINEWNYRVTRQHLSLDYRVQQLHSLSQTLSKKRSNVTTIAILCFDVRVHMYSNVDRLHVLSTGDMSIMGKNSTDDCPGCVRLLFKVCIMPCQFGTCWWN